MNARIAKTMFFRAIILIPVCLLNCTYHTPFKGVLPPPEVKPGTQVLSAFKCRYPEADSVGWSIEKGYYVATFTLTSAPASAWFSEDGKCLLSVKEYPFEQLSDKISGDFFNGNYAGWEVKHVNLLERIRMGTLYIICVTDNSRYLDLYYSGLGNLIRVYAHAGNFEYAPVTVPPKISRLVDSLFNKPEIIDIWKGALSINVAVIDSIFYQFAAFTYNHDWICTFWEVSKEDVPQKVIQGFSSSEFGAYPVNFVRLLRSDKLYLYLFYFTTNNKTRHVLYIKENGDLHSLVTY